MLLMISTEQRWVVHGTCKTMFAQIVGSSFQKARRDTSGKRPLYQRQIIVKKLILQVPGTG